MGFECLIFLRVRQCLGWGVGSGGARMGWGGGSGWLVTFLGTCTLTWCDVRVGWGGVNNVPPARHCIDEMSRTVEIKKVNPHRSNTRLWRCCLEQGKTTFIIGGDNSAECEISRVKGQLQRTNMLGRMSPKNSQVHQFAAAPGKTSWDSTQLTCLTLAETIPACQTSLGARFRHAGRCWLNMLNPPVWDLGHLRWTHLVTSPRRLAHMMCGAPSNFFHCCGTVFVEKVNHIVNFIVNVDESITWYQPSIDANDGVKAGEYGSLVLSHVPRMWAD